MEGRGVSEGDMEMKEIEWEVIVEGEREGLEGGREGGI